MWLSTNGADEIWGIYITGCLISHQLSLLRSCNFILIDVDGGDYDEKLCEMCEDDVGTPSLKASAPDASELSLNQER